MESVVSLLGAPNYNQRRLIQQSCNKNLPSWRLSCAAFVEAVLESNWLTLMM